MLSICVIPCQIHLLFLIIRCLPELRLIQLCIGSACLYQILMLSAFYDLSVFHHQNFDC